MSKTVLPLKKGEDSFWVSITLGFLTQDALFPTFPDAGWGVGGGGSAAQGSGEEEEGGRHDSHCALAGRGAQGLRGHRSLPIFTTATLYIPCKGQPKKHH